MRKVLFILVILLVMANIVYWSPIESDEDKRTVNKRSSPQNIGMLNEINSLALISMSDDSVERDLFLPVERKVTVEIPDPVLPLEQNKEVAPIIIKEEIPDKHNNLNQYRLTGVLVRNNDRIAYIIDGSRPIVAKSGDSLSGNVYVVNVSSTKATIKDSITGYTKQLKLSSE